jgi:two-component system sensor histidine kinase BarA
MLRHTIYEYCDFNLYKTATFENASINPINKTENFIGIFDWPLALERAANRSDLAKEMFIGLINSLPETKQSISEAITCQNDALVKSLIHKLNGACCYSGVPNLASISLQIETSLKQGICIDDLEPELLEFFEHLDNLIEKANEIIASLE